MKLYVLAGREFIKVGITTDVAKRLKGLNGGMLPFPVELAALAKGPAPDIRQIEQTMLLSLPGRVRGEWFSTESLTLDFCIAELRRLSSGRRAESRVYVWEGDKARQKVRDEIAKSTEDQARLNLAVNEALHRPDGRLSARWREAIA